MIKAYAALEAGGPLQPFEYDPGSLGADEVEITVDYCGICHSDLSMLNNEWGRSSYPLVPGHEVVGRVAAVGAGVGHLAVGQTVGLGWHSGYCMACPSCMAGDHNLCAEVQGTIVGHHGGFADRVRAQAASVLPLPEGLEPASAGPLFCGGITVFNPLLQFDIQAIDSVGVIGIGGSMVAMLWTYLFNLGFDLVLRRFTGRTDKGLILRVFHAVLYEVGLVLALMPAIAWYLGITLWQALSIDIVFALFFMAYAFFFNLAYDWLFPVPE